MSDGQTFYAVMMLLYLWSCIRPLAPNSTGICKRALRGWKFHPPVATLAGVRKTLFIAPLLPWPAALVASQPQSESAAKVRGSMASSLRLTRLLTHVSSDLRILSMGVFISFFGLIPYCYYTEGASNKTFSAIGLSFFLMILAASRFIGLHRRFAPHDRVERYKQLFLTLTMPWHAMRLSDELLLNPQFSTAHPLALVSLTNDQRGKQFLATSLREAIYLKDPIYSEKEVRNVYKNLHIDAEIFLTEPSPDGSAESTSYCPCCHNNYTASIDVCVDCDKTPLHKYKAE